jgi:hypothetical protein
MYENISLYAHSIKGDKEVECENRLIVRNVIYLNPGQPRTLLQLKLVGILTINLILT